MSEQAATGKKERERSTIAFPYGDLQDAINVASAISHKFGLFCTVDQLAATLLHDSHRSGAFQLKLQAGRLFGLIETERDRVTLTALGKKILDPSGEAAARAEAFLTVPLYKQLYDTFKGNRLPAPSGLQNMIVQMGVPQKQADKARQAFQRSADQAGYLWAGNDRLVLPPITSLGELMETPAPSNTQVATTIEAESPPRSGLHAAIKGYLEELPQRGETWNDTDLQAWITGLESTLRIVYKVKNPAAPNASGLPREQSQSGELD